MGAERFEDVVVAASTQEAFEKAVQEARYEYGNRGYTGTVAEKDDYFVVDPRPFGMDSRSFSQLYKAADWDNDLGDLATPEEEAYVREVLRKVDDKFGPAGMLELDENDPRARKARKESGEAGGRVFLLWGVAAS